MTFPAFPRLLRLAAGATVLAAEATLLAVALLLDVAGVSPAAAQPVPALVAAEPFSATARRMAASGASQRCIAAELGVSRATVRRFLGATF
jgi:hypothetical protein